VSARVVVRGLSQTFAARRIFTDLSFELQNSQMILLQGANGSGKTTLLKILSGLTRPDAGEVLLDGEVLVDTSQKVKREIQIKKVGAAFLSMGFPSQMPVKNIIDAVTEFGGVRYAELLSHFDLEKLRFQPFGKCSSGQKHLLVYLSSFAHSPDFIILDEPWSFLDEKNLQRFQQLCHLERTAGKTLFISAHGSKEFAVNDFCYDKILRLEKGIITESYLHTH
jgi:ABC-type multidrug transport system ATPase subunit